ncbi:MAG: Hsp70 protein that interacts with Zuo1p [Phylliscum demangeonii]|nr:MAG: Hsp70 protein that interacts with Zuo1p [Phylliscum demangeonii]
MSDQESAQADTPEERIAIGISFGNSNSSIAHTSPEGKVEVIANEEGDRQIPSVLSYTGDDEYHGTQAKAQLVRNSGNTIAYFRDFLGKDFKSIDPTACHASAHPIEHEGTTAFQVQERPSEPAATLTVSEVCTRHFRRLASSASDYLGRKVNAAVVTVPTDFSDAQRAALITGAEKTGLQILQLIKEPVAAVLAYDARPDATVSDKIVLVADFGGTRSDAAIVASRGGIYSTLATAHDYELGGAQLDQVLIDFFAKEFMKKHKTDPRENARSLAKLKLEVEATKKALSLGSSASLSIESLADGIDFSSNVNRVRYDLLAGKVFGDFVRFVESVVQKAGLDVLDVDEVILAGGTSHTPKIAQLLRALFPTTTAIWAPSTKASALNPSELAVRGAAIQASLVQEFDREDIQQSTHPMVTVTPHLTKAIGVVVFVTGKKDDELDDEHEQGEEIFHPLLEADTAVPARRAAIFPVPKGARHVLIQLCEGRREIRVRTADRHHRDPSKPKPTPKPKPDQAQINGAKANDGEDDDDDDDVDDEDGDDDDHDHDDDDDDEEDDDDDGHEPRQVRKKVWRIETVLAEAAVRNLPTSGPKHPARIEVTASVAADLSLQLTAREVGAKGAGGVRGGIDRARERDDGGEGGGGGA